MPELPDLQVFSHNLNKKLKGNILKHINVPVDRKLNVPVKQLQEALEGQKLVDVKRVGKELHFEFSHDQVLGMHLMLYGQLFFFENDNTNKFTIAELMFDGGTGLALTDFQKAAVLTLNPEPNDAPDALDADFNYLKAKLSKLKKPVKTVLLDQHMLRGIGNAYADEILWHARISPLSIANKLPDEQLKALVKSINHVLNDAEKQILKARPDAISGEYRDFLVVHQPRQKQTSTGATIHQKEIGSRKTYYTDEQQLFS